MGEVRKIVVEHYPVERLPDDLRIAAGDAERVRITVEREDARMGDAARAIGALQGAGKGCYTEDEAVEFIRSLRDEK